MKRCTSPMAVLRLVVVVLAATLAPSVPIARPATGFGLSWAAKEYVNSQLASRKRHGDVRAVLSPGADAAAKALAEPPKEEKK